MHSTDTDELYILNVNALIECLITALFIFVFFHYELSNIVQYSCDKVGGQLLGVPHPQNYNAPTVHYI